METGKKTELKRNENSSKKKHEYGMIIVFFLLVAIAFTIGLSIYNSPENRISRQLDLGQKYLEEQNYEQAVVAFNKVIEIDPMSVEAYLGLANAYVGLGDMDSAIAILEEGYEVTKDENINQMLKDLRQQMITGDFSVLGIVDEYDGFGYANNGILVVGKGELWGAIDYNNNIIVPLEYTYGCQTANDDGYMWFGNENGYYVFDKKGQVVFETKNPIKSISEGVVLCTGIVGTDYVVEYTNLDGSVLFQRVVPNYEEYVDIVSAVGFNDGKAYTYIVDESEESKEYFEVTLNGEVTDVSEKYYKVYESSGVVGDKILTAKSADNAGWPISAVNDGYFVSRIYDEVSVTSASDSEWKDVGLGEYFYDYNYTAEKTYDSWSITGYFKDGVWIYNKKSLACLCLNAGEEKMYLLIDAWNEDNRKLAEFDYLKLNDENLWLISRNEKWGYTDHTGKVIALYDDAADFNNGKAIIIENGNAYMVDESQNKLNKGCKAKTVACYGDIWALTIEGKKYFVDGMK